MDALIAFRIKALALQEALFDSTSSDDDDDPLDVLDHVELHNTLGTPYSIIRSFVNSTDQQKQVTLNRDTLKRVETKLNRAFIQFYHKIGLLKSYSFLNILAFSKIMKKYDKITLRSESTCYMNMLDNSYFGISDELTKLMERVEVAFIKHFSNSNRRKGMNILRPKTKKAAYIVSFFTVLALTSVLMNLDMEMDPKTNDYKALTGLLPLGLVLLQDFFLADQLTSQVQAFRSRRLVGETIN
ncbi:hypothetical protein QYF36_018058 [Acer negundo]|nr:hypothetical protein QYF36_018058 [Acer negundo]